MKGLLYRCVQIITVLTGSNKPTGYWMSMVLEMEPVGGIANKYKEGKKNERNKISRN